LYLSQKSNADDILKVAGGSYAKYAAERTGESVAAMKADGVVIMSRQSGIRLITGTDQRTSAGGKNSGKFGIDLIAGNEDSDLQPLVKGNNLVLYLQGLSKALDNLADVTYDFLTSQLVFNSVMAVHQHYDPFLIFLGSLGGSGPLSLLGGKNFPSPEAAQQGTKAMLEQLKQHQQVVLVHIVCIKILQPILKIKMFCSCLLMLKLKLLNNLKIYELKVVDVLLQFHNNFNYGQGISRS